MSNSKKRTVPVNDIPPFPFPFEYCPVERAAKLFDCEIEDLQHLQSIGAIDFYVNLEDQEFFSNFSARTEILIDSFSAGELRTCSISRQLCGMSAQWNKTEEVEISEGVIEIENASVWAYGFMKADLDMLPDLKMLAFHINSDLSHEGESELILYKRYEPDEIELGGLPVFLLLRKDLDKIHESIHSGNRLDSVFNNKQLAKARAEKQKVASEKSARTMPKQSDLIVALIKSHPSLGEEVLNEPYKAWDIITTQFSGDEIPYNTDITKESVGNWIKAGTNK